MKKISLKIMIITSIIVFIFSFGATYAINVWSSGNTLISGTTRCFKVNYTKGQDINFTDGLVAQTSFDKDNSVSTTLTISRNSNCDICGIGSISANITSTIDDLSSGGLSYKIYRGVSLVKSGNIIKNGISVLYDNFDINDTKVSTYTIYFYLDSNKINNNYLETSFSGKIYAEAKSTKEICNISSPDDLYNNIASMAVLDNKKSTYVSSTSGVDFSKISSDTNGKGIYIRSGNENDTYPIYYYRGAVDNNNVIFANFCWKIIRTTEKGGVKLIYNGVPSTDGTCNNTGENSQLGGLAYNTEYNKLAYVGYMYGDISHSFYLKAVGNIPESTFMSDVVWNGSTYSLASGASTTVISDYATAYADGTLSNYHYTCFNGNTSCSTIYFAYFFNASHFYYFSLSNGETVNDVLNNSLYNNSSDSNVKTFLENWYSQNLSNYTDNYIDDVGYCNDRSIGAKGGWNPNGGSGFLYFSHYGRRNSAPMFSCNTVDKFSVSSENGNGKSLYPIGLITADEVRLAGGSVAIGSATEKVNKDYYLYSSQVYWTMTPYIINHKNSLLHVVDQEGKISSNGAIDARGIRPVIALKNNVNVISGDGSVSEPYFLG